MKPETLVKVQRYLDFIRKTETLAQTLAATNSPWLNRLGVLLQAAKTGLEFSSINLEKTVRSWPFVQELEAVAHPMDEFLSGKEVYREENLILHKKEDLYVIRAVGRHSDCWIYCEQPETLVQRFREHAWSRFNNSIMLKAETFGFHSWQTAVTFTPPSEQFVADSKTARDLWDRLGPFLVRGKNRSVLLDGVPGVGKSSIARGLAQRAQKLLGGRMLTAHVEDLDQISPSQLTNIIKVMQPQILLIDDFDRLSRCESFLTFLERCREWVKFLVVTTNHGKELDTALLRPKRFDEVTSIHKLEEHFASKNLGVLWDKLTPETQTKIDSWPAVYVWELGERVAVLGTEPEEEAKILDARARAALPKEEKKA